MEILTRKQFIKLFDNIMRKHGMSCADPNHPLWEAERWQGRDEQIDLQCKYFVCVKPVKWEDRGGNAAYWAWVEQSMIGDTACFSCDTREQREWWGFTKKKDIMLWSLKWLT